MSEEAPERIFASCSHYDDGTYGIHALLPGHPEDWYEIGSKAEYIRADRRLSPETVEAIRSIRFRTATYEEMTDLFGDILKECGYE